MAGALLASGRVEGTRLEGQPAVRACEASWVMIRRLAYHGNVLDRKMIFVIF